MDGDTARIGQAARKLRTAQGKTVAVVAGQAGMDTSFLSRLERGERRWTRQLVEHVANALDVNPAALLGQPDTTSPDGLLIAQGVRRIRRALTDTSLEYGAACTPRPLDALRVQAAEITRMRMAADYLGLGLALPPAIRELHALRDQRAALVLLGEVLGAASHMLTVNGAYAESLLACDRRREAAGLTGDDRELAGVEWSRAHALVPDGSTFVALKATSAAAEAIPRTEGNLPTFGALLLIGAYASAVRGELGDAQARLGEALEVASRTGECGPPFAFGPNNVRLHEMAAALECSDPDGALRAGQLVDPRTIGTRERAAMFHADRGRSLTATGHTGDAVRAFTAAERIAPHRVHANPWVRDSIAEILDNARRVAGGPQLRGLARRFGVVAA